MTMIARWIWWEWYEWNTWRWNVSLMAYSLGENTSSLFGVIFLTLRLKKLVCRRCSFHYLKLLNAESAICDHKLATNDSVSKKRPDWSTILRWQAWNCDWMNTTLKSFSFFTDIQSLTAFHQPNNIMIGMRPPTQIHAWQPRQDTSRPPTLRFAPRPAE